MYIEEDSKTGIGPSGSNLVKVDTHLLIFGFAVLGIEPSVAKHSRVRYIPSPLFLIFFLS